MKMSTNDPTNLVLVGVIFMIISVGLASSAPQLDVQEQLNKFKTSPIYSLHQESSSKRGVLQAGEETIYFPWHKPLWASRPAAGLRSASPEREEIVLDTTNSSASVGDILAINSAKERDILYDDTQRGDPDYQGLANSLLIDVGGRNGEEADIENSELEAGQSDRSMLLDSDMRQVGNYLTVNVHDISVTAMNNVPGGNAVATSNIVIEPVQVIVCPSEVKEKLK